jgi:hypothetical protein
METATGITEQQFSPEIGKSSAVAVTNSEIQKRLARCNTLQLRLLDSKENSILVSGAAAEYFHFHRPILKPDNECFNN